MVSRDGIEPSTRRLRVVLSDRNSAISEGFCWSGLQNAADGCRTRQPPRNRNTQGDEHGGSRRTTDSKTRQVHALRGPVRMAARRALRGLYAAGSVAGYTAASPRVGPPLKAWNAAAGHAGSKVSTPAKRSRRDAWLTVLPWLSADDGERHTVPSERVSMSIRPCSSFRTR